MGEKQKYNFFKMFGTKAPKAGASYPDGLRTQQQPNIIRANEKMEPWKLLENFVNSLLSEITPIGNKRDFEKKKTFLVNELVKVSDGKTQCTVQSSIEDVVGEIRDTLDKVIEENDLFQNDV